MNKSIISIFGAVAAVLASPASAATFAFVIGGFGEGAMITGSFTGADLNNNGALELGIGGVPNEITALTASYSGNSYSSAFTISLGDPGYQAMIYALGATTFAATSGPFERIQFLLGCRGQHSVDVGRQGCGLWLHRIVGLRPHLG